MGKLRFLKFSKNDRVTTKYFICEPHPMGKLFSHLYYSIIHSCYIVATFMLTFFYYFSTSIDNFIWSHISNVIWPILLIFANFCPIFRRHPVVCLVYRAFSLFTMISLFMLFNYTKFPIISDNEIQGFLCCKGIYDDTRIQLIYIFYFSKLTFTSKDSDIKHCDSSVSVNYHFLCLRL